MQRQVRVGQTLIYDDGRSNHRNVKATAPSSASQEHPYSRRLPSEQARRRRRNVKPNKRMCERRTSITPADQTRTPSLIVPFPPPHWC
jgi:hypothetical protein